MLRTFGSELPSLVNSDPSSWKVPKGSRSASRRTRTTVSEGLRICRGLINKSSDSSNMPISGSDKHEASMLDCHFSEKAEHVPIKKRRFLLRSPSPPPPVVASPCADETVDFTSKNMDPSYRLAAAESASSDIILSKITDNNISLHDKPSEKANKSFGEGEDFSGISILAAAACSSSLGKYCGYAEDCLGVEDSSVQWRAAEVSAVIDTPLSTEDILKEENVNSSEVSTGGTSSCVSLELAGQIASTSYNVNSSKTYISAEDAKDFSITVGPSILSRDVSYNKSEGRLGRQKLCPQDDRFHWDLNVMMDAWDEPFDLPVEQKDVPCTISQDIVKMNHGSKNTNSYENHDFSFKRVTTCAQMPGERRKSDYLDIEEKKANYDLGKCHDFDHSICLDEKPALFDYSNLDVMKSMSEDGSALFHNRIAKSDDGSGYTVLDSKALGSASGTKNNNDDVPVQSLKSNGFHLTKSLILEGWNLNSGGFYPKLENLRSACLSDDMRSGLKVCSSSDVKLEVMPTLAVLDSANKTEELHYNTNSAIENGGMSTAELREHPTVASDVKDMSHSSHAEVLNTSSSKCKLQMVLDTEEGIGDFKGAKLECRDDPIGEVFKISLLSKVTSESVSQETCKANLDEISNSLGKIDVSENVGCCFLPMVGVDKNMDLQEDYDSQYEDGEVRDPNQHIWEGYDVLDRDVEHVDYESDDLEANPTGYPVSVPDQVEIQEGGGPEGADVVSSSVCDVNNEVGGDVAECMENNGDQEEDNQLLSNFQSDEKTKTYMSKEPLASGGNSSDIDIGVSCDDGRKDRMASHTDRLVDSKALETGVEAKQFRRGLQSRIEGLVANDVSSREERRNKMDNRYEECSSMRSFERTRYSYRNQARGRPTENWDGFPDNRKRFRRHYSPITHRLSKVSDDASIEMNDIGYLGVHDDVPYSHQLLPKGRSRGNGDECTGLHPRYKPNRAFSPSRPGTFGRGRSVRYGSLVDNSGGRVRYNGPSPEDSFQSSLKYRRPLSRRERSFSPFGGRRQSNANHCLGKSLSQSRSRSPIMWKSPRGQPEVGSSGGTFIRHRSRSPNFGPEVRMQRLRSAHHQPGFGVADGFRSIPRGRGSPPRGRWSSAGKEENAHFRDFSYNKQRNSGLERSPGRIRMRGDRICGFDPSRNLKPEGYFRISEDATFRGVRYEENYDGRRKHYALLRPARCSYEDNLAGRLNQDVDNNFSIPKGIRDRSSSDFQGRRLRGMDNCINDTLRRFRGEQHSFMCERDGQFNSTSKQFEHDAIDSSHNRKSVDQYRSSHFGRFNDMDGVNRGRRYDNFEDRRKQYPLANLMKRNDTDGSEKRLNHNFDENFQDAQDFCARGVRSFDGRGGGLSTRLREDKDSLVCGQEKKLEENTQ